MSIGIAIDMSPEDTHMKEPRISDLAVPLVHSALAFMSPAPFPGFQKNPTALSLNSIVSGAKFVNKKIAAA